MGVAVLGGAGNYPLARGRARVDRDLGDVDALLDLFEQRPIRIGELAVGTPYEAFTLETYLKAGGNPLATEPIGTMAPDADRTCRLAMSARSSR